MTEEEEQFPSREQTGAAAFCAISVIKGTELPDPVHHALDCIQLRYGVRLVAVAMEADMVQGDFGRLRITDNNVTSISYDTGQEKVQLIIAPIKPDSRPWDGLDDDDFRAGLVKTLSQFIKATTPEPLDIKSMDVEVGKDPDWWKKEGGTN